MAEFRIRKARFSNKCVLQYWREFPNYESNRWEDVDYRKEVNTSFKFEVKPITGCK